MSFLLVVIPLYFFVTINNVPFFARLLLLLSLLLGAYLFSIGISRRANEIHKASNQVAEGMVQAVLRLLFSNDIQSKT